jgi:hypothetical protein
VITVAAEMFMHHLTEKTYDVVKSERKPRRNIQYKDVGMATIAVLHTWHRYVGLIFLVANAVARFDNLEFLSDVVPRTTTYKDFKQKQAKQANGQPLANGQTTLDGKKPLLDEPATEDVDEGATEEDEEMVEAPEMSHPAAARADVGMTASASGMQVDLGQSSHHAMMP